MSCKFKDVPNWYGDHDSPRKECTIDTHQYIGKTLKQVICDVYGIKGGDIKNNPKMFQLCCEPILDYNVLIDGSFSQKCISKSPIKNFPLPGQDFIERCCPELTMDNYNYGRDIKYFSFYDDHIDILDECDSFDSKIITTLRK